MADVVPFIRVSNGNNAGAFGELISILPAILDPEARRGKTPSGPLRDSVLAGITCSWDARIINAPADRRGFGPNVRARRAPCVSGSNIDAGPQSQAIKVFVQEHDASRCFGNHGQPRRAAGWRRAD